MRAEQWNLVSEWHNAWLAADADERRRLGTEFAAEQPDLAAEVDDLGAVSAGLQGFLETPAFVLAAHDLAQDIPSLDVAAMVGPYRIAGLLARGGMGDVYRATDVRLQRDVALKILSHGQTGDPDRVDRFLQEARVTASLDHPNVVSLYDVGLHKGTPYLVTELLEGETLRARIDRGSPSPEDARRIAAEVASGLVAAHAAGLVHRDLKPENIFVTRSGVTKILDFGIAKLAQNPTIPKGLSTLTGVLLGTAGYLAPEQIRGDAVDGRADLFALGSIRFEMLTGQRAFSREHTIDTLHAITHDAPPDVLQQRADIPPALASVVMRLFEKTPVARFQSAADLKWALEQIAGGRGDLAVRVRSRRNWTPPLPTRAWLWGGAVAIIAMVVAAGWWSRHQSIPEGAGELTRFTWSLPVGVALDSAPVVSPNGRAIVFSGVDASGRRLFVRWLDSLEATAIAGTEGGRLPFWSPDGSSLGFFARGQLVKIALAGGAPVVICDAPDGRGGTWSRSGTIVFGPDLIESALARVSADGGRVEPATLLDLSKSENSHRWPVFLPDGIHFLYFVRSSSDDRRGVYVGRVDQPASMPGSPLFRSESEAVYAPPPSGRGDGVLLSVANGRMEARRFDAAHLALVGDARTIPLAAGGNGPYNPAMLSASAELLAFVSSPIPYGNRLASVARNGTDVRFWNEREAQNWPRLSPDGRRIARQRIDVVRGNPDIWVEDAGKGRLVRVTTAVDNDVLAVWSPDGSRLVYVSGRSNDRHLAVAAADGTGVIGTLRCPGTYCEPTDWSRDGQSLLVNVRDNKGDVWIVSTDPKRSSHPLLAEAFTERDARFSPDDHWVAYVSEESGGPEVFVRSFSGLPKRFPVSSGGGDQPVWRPDGTELFYVNLQGRLRSVSFRPAAVGNPFGVPVELNVPSVGAGHWGTQYDVSADGRVYFLDRATEPPPHEIGLILGWPALLK
jgi:eukaryotic-like serine/threonine-protein kinase